MIWYEYRFVINQGLVPNEAELNKLTAVEGWELRDWQLIADGFGPGIVCCLRRPIYFSDPDGKKYPISGHSTPPFDKPAKT